MISGLPAGIVQKWKKWKKQKTLIRGLQNGFLMDTFFSSRNLSQQKITFQIHVVSPISGHILVLLLLASRQQITSVIRYWHYKHPDTDGRCHENIKVWYRALLRPRRTQGAASRRQNEGRQSQFYLQCMAITIEGQGTKLVTGIRELEQTHLWENNEYILKNLKSKYSNLTKDHWLSVLISHHFMVRKHQFQAKQPVCRQTAPLQHQCTIKNDNPLSEPARIVN